MFGSRTQAGGSVAYPALVMLTGPRVPRYWLAEVYWLIILSPLLGAAVLTGSITPLQPHRSGGARAAAKRTKQQRIKQVVDHACCCGMQG